MGEEKAVVGIAEYRIAQFPVQLAAYGLGSCVGVTLWDPVRKAGGLAHVMLPSSRLAKEQVVAGKYADTAVEALAGEMLKAGSQKRALVSKIVGGANMFSALAQSAFPIGLRNVAAVREKLAEMGIPILVEEVGGTQGRTVLFNLDDGRMEIRKLNQPTQFI
jgi:chemotaxis protein CheD